MKTPTILSICLGTGGVGKTSLAAALGFFYASQKLKTLVITIDPSQRLKTTLNLKPHGENQALEENDISPYLYACLLDSQLIFDDFVKRGLKDPEKAQKLIKNRLYQQLSTNLNGSQEFTALEKLLFEYESGQWDRIILDTPPAAHALDFLRAPQKLNHLLNEKIAKWFRSPDNGGHFLNSFLHFGTRQLMKALELLTGKEFIQELSDFFNQIQFWQKRLEDRLIDVQRLLNNDNCSFLLITSYDEGKLQEGLQLLKTLNLQGLKLQTIIVNRSYPAWLDLNPTQFESPATRDFFLTLKSYYQERARIGKQLLLQSSIKTQFIEIPEYNQPINGLEDILTLSQEIERLNL